LILGIENIRLFAGTHAIEAVNFIVRLGIPIQSSDIRRFDERAESLKALFPAVNDVPGIYIQVAPGRSHVSEARPPPAKELVYFSNAGQPIWVGKFQDDFVTVSCREYSTWEDIWPEAKRRLNALLDCVDRYKPVLSVDYSVTDTFSADLSENALLARNLFKDSPFLPPNLVSQPDPRWDIGQGWFDSADSGNRVLVRVDAKSAVENEKAIASICNLYSQRFGQQISIGDIAGSDDNAHGIERVFSKFHDANKKLLRKILADHPLVRMRLKELD